MTKLYSPSIECQSGTHFPFLQPTAESVVDTDIAYALANTCRFNGHVPFYSVAEHSVAVAVRLPPHLQLAGLLHDAAEAYLSDIPSPIKQYLPDYCAMEDKIQAVIYEKYSINLTSAEISEIKAADKDATATEAFHLLPSKGAGWTSVLFTPQAQYAPRLLPPPAAYKLFMHWFSSLTESLESKLTLV